MFASIFTSLPSSVLLISASIFIVCMLAKHILDKQARQFTQLRRDIQLLKMELIAYLAEQEKNAIRPLTQNNQNSEVSQEVSESATTDTLSQSALSLPVSATPSELEVQTLSQDAYVNTELEASVVDFGAEKVTLFEAAQNDEVITLNDTDAQAEQVILNNTDSVEQISLEKEFAVEQTETVIDPIEVENRHVDNAEIAQDVSPTWIEKQIERVKNWFFAGNWPVNIGILIFLIGIGALLRYLIQTGIIDVSISARLAGVGVVGIAGLFMGWKTRLSKPIFGLALQGGSVGVLLLVVFAASKLYDVIPISMAFGITVVILAASIIMSLKQNALVLVAFAICAAYTAPLWLSTGSNNFVGLFSYYALINVVVVIMALFRSWPLLNTIGYIFNAGVGSLWAHYNYVTENFVVIQFFIALFFLFFTVIPIIYSRRTPLDVLFKNKKVNWVAIHSYLLMLITPGIVVIWEHRLFQTGIPWENIDTSILLACVIWGIAAVQFGLGYLQMQHSLHKEQGRVYYWLALGLATIAVPIAFSTDITGILFIAEGVMLYYIAAKALPMMVRNALNILALALHGLAIFLIIEPTLLTIYAAFALEKMSLNDYLLTFSLASGMAISIHALSKQLARVKDQMTAHNSIQIQIQLYTWIAFMLGLCSITALVQYKLPQVHAFELLAFIFTTLTIALFILASRYWPKVRHLNALASFSFFVLAGYACLGFAVQFDALNGIRENLLPSKLALINFLLLPIGLGYLLIQSSKKLVSIGEENLKRSNIGHRTNQVLFSIIVCSVFYRVALVVIGFIDMTSYVWIDALSLLPLAFIGYYLIKLYSCERLHAFLPYKFVHTGLICIWASIAVIFVLLSLFEEGVSDPILWLPIINPVELPQLALGACLLLAIQHFMQHVLYPRGLTPALQESLKVTFYWIAGTVAFLFIQMVLIRMIYHWMLQDEIYWTLQGLFARSQIQATLTLYWSVLAIIFWMYGAKKANKSLWIIGAVLFGMALCKLLFIDRQHLGALPGIISFIVYGLFCVIIGYFLPPPKSNKAASANPEDGIQNSYKY